ncbi:MAG: DnaJ domain-containing protein [Alphaproteobacteria bacterium]|nr:DnaJ domain-containing protein [Alphaproteobacteria bacterium]
MTQKRDYYEVLGVERTASADEIKKAYQKSVMRNHPDRVKHNAKLSDAEKAERLELFQLATEAEKILSDPSARAAYDQYGHKGIDNMKAGKNAGSGQSFADVAGPTMRRTYSESDTMDFFQKRHEQREQGKDPDASLGDGLSAAERRQRAAEERRRRRNGGGTETSASTPVVSTPAATETVEEDLSDSFQQVADKVADTTQKLRQSGTAAIPLDKLEAFRDSLKDFMGEVDKAIARAKKGGPAL